MDLVSLRCPFLGNVAQCCLPHAEFVRIGGSDDTRRDAIGGPFLILSMVALVHGECCVFSLGSIL